MARIRMGTAGLTLLELLFAIAIGLTVTGIAIPVTVGVVEEIQSAAAARYLAGRIMWIRMHAVRRSTAVALRFVPAGSDYTYAVYEDGNGNGVRTADIAAGVDRRLTPDEMLHHKFPGVTFALPPGLRDLDNAPGGTPDGVRIGTARILTMTPDGACTSGTLYLTGRGGVYAVRTLGATGRTRVFRFDSGRGAWIQW